MSDRKDFDALLADKANDGLSLLEYLASDEYLKDRPKRLQVEYWEDEKGPFCCVSIAQVRTLHIRSLERLEWLIDQVLGGKGRTIEIYSRCEVTTFHVFIQENEDFLAQLNYVYNVWYCRQKKSA